TVDVERWRAQQIASGILGTSVNRYMVPLGNIFTDMARFVALERVEAFKQPAENPCQKASKAPLRKRERQISDYELRKLHMAFTQLGDTSGWDNCTLALTTALSLNDLKKLSAGSTVNLERSKTGVAVNIPIAITQNYDWTNWTVRFRKARKAAGLV